MPAKPTLTPSPSAPRHSIAHITQPTSHPTHGIAQVGRRRYRDDHEARHRRFCRPVAHAMPPATDHRSTAPDARHRSARERPTTAVMSLLACRHAPFKPFSEGKLIDRSQDIDDLLLIDVCHCHLVPGRHASILRAYLSCADSRAGVFSEDRIADVAGHGHTPLRSLPQSVVETREPTCVCIGRSS